MTTHPANSPAANPPLDEEDEVELVKTLLAETREEITRADSKTAILLAAAGIGASALLAGLIAGSWAPSDISNRFEWLWWGGLTAAAYGVWRLAKCLLPVVDNGEHPDRIDYYGDINRLASAEALAEALAAGPADLSGRMVRQLYVNARIVSNKYAHLRAALLALGIGAGLVAAAVLADLLW